MKLLTSSFFRAICILLLGIFLVMYPDKTTELLVIGVGFAFLIPSIVLILAYFMVSRRDKNLPDNFKPRFPIMEIGSMLFGLILILMPTFFITILMYVLGVMLILFATNQIVNLVAIRHMSKISLGFYVIPVLILAMGIVILFNPIDIASSPFLILGICCIVSGLSDLINIYRIRQARKEFATRTYNESQISHD